jgi:hypothetical protein
MGSLVSPALGYFVATSSITVLLRIKFRGGKEFRFRNNLAQTRCTVVSGGVVMKRNALSVGAAGIH